MSKISSLQSESMIKSVKLSSEVCPCCCPVTRFRQLRSSNTESKKTWGTGLLPLISNLPPPWWKRDLFLTYRMFLPTLCTDTYLSPMATCARIFCALFTCDCSFWGERIKVTIDRLRASGKKNERREWERGQRSQLQARCSFSSTAGEYRLEGRLVDQIQQQLSCQNSASDQSEDEDLLAILKENKRKTRQKNSRTLHSRKTKTKTTNRNRIFRQNPIQAQKAPNLDYE